MKTNRACEVHFGVVQSVQSTTSPKSLTAKVDGGSTNVPSIVYLTNYSPAVGDTVVLLLLGSDDRTRQSWLAIGALA